MKDIAGWLFYGTKMDTSGLEEGIYKGSKKASELGNVLTVALGNLLADLTAMAVKGLSEIASAGVQYNAEIEKYQTALTTLTGSADKASGIIEQIKKDAASTPFDVKGLTQANQLLISAGVSSDQAREDVLALGNAISATGGGNEELQRMAVNLQQIKNVGEASAQDMKQFAYAGIDLTGLLADYLGKTREEISKSDRTYENITGALKAASEEGGKYYGAMEAQSKTYNGQISNLKDNLNSFMGEAARPFFNLLKNDIFPVINDIIQGNGDLSTNINQLAKKITNFIGNVLMGLIDMLPELMEIGIQIIISLIEGISKQLPELIPEIVEIILTIIDTLIENLPLIISAGIDLIVALAIGLIDAIPVLVDKIPEIINSLVAALTDPTVLMKLVQAGILLIVAIIKGIAQTAITLVANVAKIPLDMIDKLKKQFEKFKTVGKDLMKGLYDGIVDRWNSLKKKVEDLGKGIVSKFKSVFGIKSPSRIMRDVIGKQLTAGIAVGIETNTDEVDNAIDDLNDNIIDRMTKAVNIETGKNTYSGTNGTITQMLSAFGTTTVVNENKLYLDGDEIYENQKTVSAKKNLQTQFGGGYSVSS